MSDYTGLIIRLRDAAKMSDALSVLLPHSEGSAVAKLHRDAADAIEELQTELLDLKMLTCCCTEEYYEGSEDG